METGYIEEFIMLAECGNSNVAAERLFISQSSLLRHVQTIEEEFGMPMFDRTHKGFVLNDAGHTFMPYAKQIADLRNHCYRSLHQEEEEQKTLRVCSHGKIIDLIIDFRKKYPDYRVVFTRNATPEKSLLEGELDIAFLTNLTPEYTGSFERIKFTHEVMLVMVYEGHPLAERDNVAIEQLQKQPVIALEGDFSVDDRFYSRMRGGSGMPNVVTVVPNPPDLIRMVQEKQGISVLHGNPEQLPHIEGIRVLKLDPSIEYDLDMYFRRGVPLRHAAEDFVNFSRKWIAGHRDVNMSFLE